MVHSMPEELLRETVQLSTFNYLLLIASNFEAKYQVVWAYKLGARYHNTPQCCRNVAGTKCRTQSAGRLAVLSGARSACDRAATIIAGLQDNTARQPAGNTSHRPSQLLLLLAYYDSISRCLAVYRRRWHQNANSRTHVERTSVLLSIAPVAVSLEIKRRANIDRETMFAMDQN